MAKPPTREQRFQTWLAQFRTTGWAPYSLLARPEMTDDQLRELWKQTQSTLKSLKMR